MLSRTTICKEKVVQDKNIQESRPNLYFATVTKAWSEQQFSKCFWRRGAKNWKNNPQQQIAHYLSGKTISINSEKWLKAADCTKNCLELQLTKLEKKRSISMIDENLQVKFPQWQILIRVYQEDW